MGTICKKCGYERRKNDYAPEYECPKCGIIYNKTKPQFSRPPLKKKEKPIYIGKLVNKKNIDQAIQKILESNEKLYGAFYGKAISDGGYGIHRRHKGSLFLPDYLLVTNTRVIIWARGLTSSSTDGFYYSDISSIEEIKSLFSGEIIINVHGTKKRMCYIAKSDIQIAIKLIREQIRKNQTQENNPSSISPHESIPDQIKKLAELRDNGILTDEEFSKKKIELLNKI